MANGRLFLQAKLAKKASNSTKLCGEQTTTYNRRARARKEKTYPISDSEKTEWDAPTPKAERDNFVAIPLSVAN